MYCNDKDFLGELKIDTARLTYDKLYVLTEQTSVNDFATAAIQGKIEPVTTAFFIGNADKKFETSLRALTNGACGIYRDRETLRQVLSGDMKTPREAVIKDFMGNKKFKLPKGSVSDIDGMLDAMLQISAIYGAYVAAQTFISMMAVEEEPSVELLYRSGMQTIAESDKMYATTREFQLSHSNVLSMFAAAGEAKPEDKPDALCEWLAFLTAFQVPFFTCESVGNNLTNFIRIVSEYGKQGT